MSQADFAWLVGCTASNIQAIEIRRRTLSEPLALRIFAETGVAPDWLLANDFNRPMQESGNGAPYAKGCYERVQAKKLAATVRDDTAVDDELLSLSAMLWSVMSAARKKSRNSGTIALFRMQKFTEDLVSEFGIDFLVYDGKDRRRPPKLLATKLAEKLRR